jgi:hypothetical protein
VDNEDTTTVDLKVVWIAVLPDLIRDVIGRVLFLRVGVHGKVYCWDREVGDEDEESVFKQKCPCL